MTTLVIAEHDNGQIKTATLSTITAALQIGGPVHVLIAGHQVEAASQEASRIQGVTRVLLADAPHLAGSQAENLAAQVLALAQPYTHLFFAATAAGKSIAPRVAARRDAAQISDVVAIEAPDTFKHPIYAGNAIATVRTADALKIATIRATAFPAAIIGDNTAEISRVPAIDDLGMSQFIRREVLSGDRPELTSARVVVSGGRGMGSAENFSLLEALADKLDAAIGASRAAVDSGYAPNDFQVGQTGKIVAPDLYIAVGISGAIQHLAGMKDAKVIVAINKDADAPIFGVADYGITADLFDAVPALTRAL